MPAVRLSAALLVSLALFAALSLCPLTRIAPTARACPVQPPTPLRMLYNTSARVAVVTVGASVLVEADEDDSSRLMRTLLSVSESLKGESEEPVLYVQHWVWQQEGQEQVEDTFKLGDKLLVFLNRQTDGGDYEVNDPRYGVKKLSDADLKVYIRRIKELASIMRQEKPDEGDIVEWLVRCAEEPATRWEGAYELSAGLDVLSAERAEAKKANDAQAGKDAAVEAPSEVSVPGAGETPAAQATADGAAVTSSAGDNNNAVPAVRAALMRLVLSGTDIGSNHAEKLTAAHKERLAAALLSADSIREGELSLMLALEKLGDERLVPFLLEQLRREPEKSSEYSGEMMKVVARVRGDEELNALAQNYYNTDAYTVMEEEDSAAGRAESGEESDEESEESEEETEADEARQAARVEAAQKSAAQRRTDLLRKFIARAEAAPADAEKVAKR